MKVYQKVLCDLEEVESIDCSFVPDIFFLFVSPKFPNIKITIAAIKQKYPNTYLMGCSTAGEIVGDKLMDNSIVLTAIQFEKCSLKQVSIDLEDHKMDSYEVGKIVSESLKTQDLKHVFVLSDGIFINGAGLVSGLTEDTDSSIGITGGLAADGSDFKDTFTISNQGLGRKEVVALGIYGDALKVDFSCNAGWDSFGMERLVTKSDKNILYELDGKPALDLYKSFLGKKADELPSSALLFPLSLRSENNQKPIIRTILGIDEETKSLTFAGNILKGSYVRLMKANIDRLINGAAESAELINVNSNEEDTKVAFLISCIGRRLVLKQYTEEELEAVSDILGDNVSYTGFYSYGEIAHFGKSSPCSLHNQTMSITTFSE